MSNRICLYSPPFSNISSYRDMIDCACDLGINAVECFSMFEFCEPDISMAEDIKKYSVEKGVSFPCFSVFCDISKTEYSSLLKRLKAYTDISAVLGSPYIHHTIVGEAYSPESVVPMGKELFETGINLVREVYDYAESIGVKAVYEEQGYIFNGCNGFEHFLDTVDRDIAVVGDFGNIYQSDGTALDFVKQNINRICHVHVKDVSVLDFNKDGNGLKTLSGKFMHPVQCGRGDAQVCYCIRYLEANGYRGYYSIEQPSYDDNPDSFSEVIKLINKVIV